MSDILKNLDRGVSRRGFLRGSGLAAASLGAGLAASTVSSFAQGQEKKEDQKPTNPDEALFAEDDKNKSNKVDANGREYRACPQCGYNMYRQGRTWTCENCGYSYVE